MFFGKSSLFTALILSLVYLVYGLAMGIIFTPASSHGVEAADSSLGKETFSSPFRAAQSFIR